MKWRAALLALALAGRAQAHSFEPALLDLSEGEGGRFEVVWKSPTPRDASDPMGGLTPELPAHCHRLDGRPAVEPEAEGPRFFAVDCGARGLRGERLAVAGLGGSQVDVIVRISWRDGHTTSGVLRSGLDELVLPGASAGTPAAIVLWRYGRLGVEHILLGIDHLLFVLGLLLLVDGWGRLALTISAFTLAHTVTLALAVLGLVDVPPAPVEAAIALSIVLVAVELARPDDAPATLARRAPWLVAFLFGLLHGLGFAGALTAVGLPADHLPLALLAFNGGVEVGQVLFVTAMLVPVRLLRRAPAWVRLVPAYAIGALAASWTLERLERFWLPPG
jgi:hydrogenase/urease accessory protein HupE